VELSRDYSMSEMALLVRIEEEASGSVTGRAWMGSSHLNRELLHTGYGCDTHGSAIFPQTDAQRVAAERVIARVSASGRWQRPITTSIEPAGPWYSGDAYHQDYLRKHPGGYTCHFLREE
jgi:hypothetical protein